MIENIRHLQASLKELTDLIKTVKSSQISHNNIRLKTKEIVDSYFRNTRKLIVGKAEQSHISQIDSEMQALLERTHKKSSTLKYKNTAEKLKKLFQETEKLMLLSNTESEVSYKYDPVDETIISTLKKIVPSAALSYEQGLIDLQGKKRLSWRGPATDFRESLRECLDHLAPDKEVIASPGFKLEKDLNGPSMKQKAIYILRNRNETTVATKTTKDAVEIIEEILGSFVRSVYMRASVSTHTPTNKAEVDRVYGLVKLVQRELLKI